MRDPDIRVVAARLAFAQGNRGLARSVLASGIAEVAQGMAFEAAIASVEAGIPEAAEELIARGVAIDPEEEAQRLGGMAVLDEARGDYAVARVRYADAVSGFERYDCQPDLAGALQGLGRCLLALGEAEEGLASLQEARRLWEGMGASARVVEIDDLLARVSPSVNGSA